MNDYFASKKKILLIAPVFFGYYKDIINELESLDYDVTYICDAPSNSNFSKALGRVNKNLIKISAERYFKRIVIPTIQKDNYDYILLVAGMTFAFTPDMICNIKEKNPKAKFVMYQWDSERNLPYSVHIHQYFDTIYSFDRTDCCNRNYYKFLPLFYTRIYEDIGKDEVHHFEFDCSYVGTAHPKKYCDVNCMAEKLKTVMPRQFIYHYMPSKLKYLYHRILSPEFRKAKYSDFKNEKVPASKLTDIFKNSKCILDAPQEGQNGLTIRTIECLGAKRKLITTNKDIVKYDFYNDKNILVFDGTIDENSVFFKCDYEPISEVVYKKYSLRSWINTLLTNSIDEKGRLK